MTQLQDTVQSRLMDVVSHKLGAKNDAHMSRLLEVAPPVISKLRSEDLYLGATMIIRIHDATGLSIREIKAMAGQKSLPSAVQVAQ